MEKPSGPAMAGDGRFRKMRHEFRRLCREPRRLRWWGLVCGWEFHAESAVQHGTHALAQLVLRTELLQGGVKVQREQAASARSRRRAGIAQRAERSGARPGSRLPALAAAKETSDSAEQSQGAAETAGSRMGAADGSFIAEVSGSAAGPLGGESWSTEPSNTVRERRRLSVDFTATKTYGVWDFLQAARGENQFRQPALARGPFAGMARFGRLRRQPALENQSGSSAQAGNLAFMGGPNEWWTAGQSQFPGFPFDHRAEAMPGGGDFARNEDGAGGKRGHDHAKAASDPLRLAFQRLLRRRIAFFGQVEELGEGDSGRIRSDFAVIAKGRLTGGEGLPTSVLATGAARPGRIDRDVSKLAGHAVAAGDQLTVGEYARAHALGNGDQHRVRGCRPCGQR